MAFIETLRDQIKRHEGAVRDSRGNHILYKCPADKWTLGYGRNVQDRGITDSEANHLLDSDILKSMQELGESFPWFNSLDDVRRGVLIDMHFNLGLPRLKTFKRTLQAIAEGDYRAASEEMLDSRWASQVGRRAITLSQQMLTGSW